ncbi:hypothetical protein ATZ36_13730 [Candidatus Endomicrobiellum trichonymphae]|uniref:Uncharacterized protein n=1 Tax=Endomicrobium trichonymphae TaxID=1408204 RepID=A0A1E5IMC0_ENDTX|nr:hypothetical protein ATZ36_13730 [Candidatus Endomicrobium trichonymphae]
MPDLMKFYNKASKKASKVGKTIKEQPLSLAAGLFNILSELAETTQRDPELGGAALFKALGSGSQLWANAKDATKKRETRRQVAAVLSNPEIKSSDKIKQLTLLGDNKAAETLAKLRAVHKSNKRSKAKLVATIAEGVLNREFKAKQKKKDRKFTAGENQKNRDFKISEKDKDRTFTGEQNQKGFDFKSGENQKNRNLTIGENTKNRNFKSGENAKNRISSAHNAINVGLSKLGRDKNLSAQDYLELIGDNNNAYHIVDNGGIPIIKIGKRSEIVPAQKKPASKEDMLYFLNDDEGN